MSPTLIKRLSYPLSTCSNWGFSIVKIVKSGVIVFREREDKIEVLLLHRQKHNDWSFPKGHVEVGEGLLEAGLRELFEETSVQPMVIGRLADLEYLNKKGELVSVAFFLGYTEKNDHQLKISPDGETAEWVPLAQVERTLSHENLRTYFKTRVKPLFSKKYFSNQVYAEVIFSESEAYKNGAELITQTFLDSDILSQCAELTKLTLKQEKRIIKRVSYFLSNQHSVMNAAFWCQQLGQRPLQYSLFILKLHHRPLTEGSCGPLHSFCVVFTSRFSLL